MIAYVNFSYTKSFFFFFFPMGLRQYIYALVKKIVFKTILQAHILLKRSN